MSDKHIIILCPHACVSISLPSTDASQHGSLLTLFLHAPLTAFCHICSVAEVPETVWHRSCDRLHKLMQAILASLKSSRDLGASWFPECNDKREVFLEGFHTPTDDEVDLRNV